MEFLQQLAQSLRMGRGLALPADQEEAYYVLFQMVTMDRHRSLTELLSSAADFNLDFQCGRAQRNLLHIAANCGSHDCLTLLLKRGANLDLQDKAGNTALHLAARNGQKKCIFKLLEAKADVTIQNNEGLTTLHWLAVNGRTELLHDLLLSQQHMPMDVDVMDSQGQTALHVASQNGHKSTVICLLDHGADVNRRNNDGSTPLHFACRHGQYRTAEILVERGALYVPDHAGLTPLDVSVQGGYSESCEYLVNRDPKLYHHLLLMVLDENIVESNLYKILQFLCKASEVHQNRILVGLGELASSSGHKLLSVSSDFEMQGQCLVRCVRLLCKLYWKQAPEEVQNFDWYSTMKNSSIFKPLELLWNTLEEWLNLLEEELTKDEPPPSQPHDADKTRIESLLDVFELEASNSSITPPHPTLPPQSTLANLSQIPFIDQEEKLELGNPESPLLNANADFSTSPPTNVDVDFSFRRVLDSLDGSPPGQAGVPVETIGSGDLVKVISPRLCAVIEAFYSCCSCQHKESLNTSPRFIEFVCRHDTVLKHLVRTNPKVIFKHFHFLLDCPELMSRFLHIVKAQPFDRRKKWFYQNLNPSLDARDAMLVPNERDTMYIQRGNVFHTSCENIFKADAEKLKRFVPSVKFVGEEGVGQGVAREWFHLLSAELLNPDYALFTQSPDGNTFQPNSNSSVNPDHLHFFRFAGQIMGLALYHRQLMGVYFTRSFYKHILGIPVSYVDVASIDPDYAKNLQWLLDHDITELGLGITFAVESDVFGELQEVELKPCGTKLGVTEANKQEYVQRVTEFRLTRGIRQQINAFLQGFHQFIPSSLVQLFDEFELEILISGLPEVDLMDWKDNTEYSGCSRDHEVILWFWQVVQQELSTEEQVLLLQFTTGSSRVPHGGFANLRGSGDIQKYTIMLTTYKPQILPSASTCVNLLKLPIYKSKEELLDRFKVALTFGTMGYATA